MLITKSLADFAESKPKLAKELGIMKEMRNNRIKDNRIYKEESDSESDENTKRKSKKCNNEEDYLPDQFSKLVGTKRRRIEEKTEPVVVKPKLRRVEKKFVPVLEKLSIEELMETNTYDRFNRTVEHVLKISEEIDFTEIGKFFLLEFYTVLNVSFGNYLAEDGIVPEENLLNRHTLQELCTEAAKLKILGATEMIPTDKLVRILHILEINIRGGDRVSPITDVSLKVHTLKNYY